MDITGWIRRNYYSKRELFNGALRDLVVHLTAGGDIQLPSGRNVFIGGNTTVGEGGARLHYSGINGYIDVTDGSLIIRADTVNGATQVAEFASDGRVTFAGQVGTAWAALPYGTGWVDFGSGWVGGGYKKVGDLVILRGLVARTSGVGTLIATLPAGFRPTAQVLKCTITGPGDVAGRVDIATDGTITHIAGGVSYVTLADTIFSTV